MDETTCVVEFFWKLQNFNFCDFYSNSVLYSPEFTVRAPVACRWLLYMFPKGHGNKKYIEIYLKRQKEDDGPEEVRIRFKISFMDVDGFLHPDAPYFEMKFTKDCEWGHNTFIKRSDIKTGEIFLPQDALTIVCQICFVEQIRPQRIIRHEIRSHDDIRNVCRALLFLHENKLHSDMILQGNNRSFNVHRCILSARVPGMYNRARSKPDNIFEDNFITEKFLSYAYTGELDMNHFCDFTHVNLTETLQEYGLLHLANNLFSNSNKFFATTHFHVENCTYSWKIQTSQLNGHGNICSTTIKDASQRTDFLIRLVKYRSLLQIEIKPSSPTNDDIYLRCSMSIKNSTPKILTSSESYCKSNTWWTYPNSLRLYNETLIMNGQCCPVDCEFFYIDFTFRYPSGNYASCVECIAKDVQQLLLDLEDLYYNQNEADTTIIAGSKKFKAHKCLLSARSPFFRAAFEQNMAEKNNNEVILKDKNLDEQTFQAVIDKLLLFIYCGKIEAHDSTFADLLHKKIDMYLVGKDY